MNIKDKLTICLLIISVIVLGFVLKSNADNVMGVNNDKDLAVLAKKNIDTFIGTEPDSSWFTKNIDIYSGINQRDATIAQSSAACMFHEESYTKGSIYNIINVININWDESKNDYHAYGWWQDSSRPNGIAKGELTSINKSYNKLVELDIFLQAMYNAYKSEKIYYNTTEKSAMKSYFYKGIQTGGFLTVDDGVGLNINPDFIGYTANEALSYKDSSSTYTANDLIRQYYANNNTGYGLTINGESTCIKEKDIDGNYTIFGPFNIHFVREINNISIVGEARSWDTDVNGKDIYYSYDKVNWSNEYSNIKANTNFYIRISDSGQEFYNQSSNITITFNQKSIQTYKARFILLKSGGNGQNLMIYAARENPLYTANAQYTVKGNILRVVKYGVGEDGNIENAKKQSQVGFIINNGSKYLKYNNGSQIVQIGKMDYNNTDFSWIEDRNSATIFETVNTVENGVNWNGYFQISNMPAGKYFIGEIYNKSPGYKDSLITSYKLDYEGDSQKESIYGEDIKIDKNISGYTDHNIQVMDIELAADGYTKVLRVYDSLLSNFNITLNKVNSSGTKIDKAEFKIQVLDANENTIGWLQKVSDTEYSYNSYYKNATVWCSTANKDVSSPKDGYVYASTKGVISITGLNTEYQYKIYEFKEGNNCYSLSEQVKKGMSVSINNKTFTDIKYNKKTTSSDKYVATDENIYCGITSDTLNKTRANITIKNISPHPSVSSFVDISGIVWLDGASHKSDEYDGIYDTANDRRLSGVKVYLKRISDNGIVKYNGDDYITSDSNGYYNFSGSVTGIKSSNLSNYYIEIQYNGIGTKYGIVEKGTGDKASKATNQGNGYASTDAIDSSNNSHMNVGLKPMPTETQSVEKWVDNVRVVIKDKNNVEQSYIYKYGQNNTGVGGGASVGIGNSSYYRTIYASDIIYSKQDNVTDGLEVYITYKIKVSNDTTIYQGDGNDAKREKYMTVDIYDKYDEDYYELADKNWKKDGEGIAKCTRTLYNKNNPDYKKNEDYKDTETIKITFKLTDGKNVSTKDAIKKILSDGSFTTSNKVEISGKHYYDKCKKYKIPITNSLGQTGYRIEYKWEENDTDLFEYAYAPGMTFSIYEQDGTVAQRTISGTVFEDNREKYNSTGKVLGNGKYDVIAGDKENSVKDVKVDLMCADSNKINGTNQKVATRYIYSEKEDENGNIVRKGEAVTKTEETSLYGTYTFDGIIPGDYYIRFTYGDGTQTIIKANGTIDGGVTAYEYKSTIVTDATLKNLIKNDRNSKKYNDNEYYWYRNLTTEGYSTAVDIFSNREYFNDEIPAERYAIGAYTPTFKISLENESETEKNSEKVKEYKIENMNFGIIDIPEIKLGFEKVMTNIRVTNTSGQIIIDGNPGEVTVENKIKYLSNLDDKSAHIAKGSDYAKIEISNEELYGAKLEITYTITIINNSDVNYYEKNGSDYYGYYYMFGEIHEDGGDNNKTHEVNVTIDQINDYLDKKLTLVGNDHIVSNKDTYTTNSYSDTDMNSTEKNILELNGGDWKKIYTGIVSRTDSKPTQDIEKIIVIRTLSNQDTNIDTTFENKAEVMKIQLTDNPKLIEDVNIHNIATATLKYSNYFTYERENIRMEEISKCNSLTVVPPTGSDKITPIIYIITIVISGIIITIGIIVIKKKVLNK